MSENRSEQESVCVVGLGYIGLPTAALLATRGFQVLGIDVNTDVVDAISDGKPHFTEPELDVLVQSAVHTQRLRAAVSPEPADVFIIAVPTPLDDTKQPVLEYVAQATETIAPFLQPGNLVILESTSPVGTTDELVANALTSTGLTIGVNLFIAHCPERVLPGRILTELVENDRVVGGVDEASTERAVAFYEQFVRGDVLGTTAKNAEMVKLVENSYRDVNIAFANEVSMLCEQERINSWDVISLANRHPRVNVLQPGPGVGGHCIAVDPWFIVHRDPEHSRLIKTARVVNDEKPEWVLRRVRESANRYKAPRIACLGLSFKADVDDLRESPACAIVNALAAERLGELLICEPNLRRHPCYELLTMEEAITAADIVVVLVDHRQFRKLTAAKLNDKVVIDTRGIIL